MAIKPFELFPTQVEAPSPEYPLGKAQNITVEGDDTGTPWRKEVVNDIFGFQQALLASANITASGDAEKVGDSQYLEAINSIIQTAIQTATAIPPQSGYTGSANTYLIDNGGSDAFVISPLITSGTTYTVGAAGSSADLTFPAMDSIPPNAKGLILSLYASGSSVMPSGGSNWGIGFDVYPDISPGGGAFRRDALNIGSSEPQEMTRVTQFSVGLNNGRFKLNYTKNNTPDVTLDIAVLTLKGFYV